MRWLHNPAQTGKRFELRCLVRASYVAFAPLPPPLLTSTHTACLSLHDHVDAEHRLEIYHSRQAIHAAYYPNSHASRVGLELAPAANPAADAHGSPSPTRRKAPLHKFGNEGDSLKDGVAAVDEELGTACPCQYGARPTSPASPRSLTDSVYTGCDDAVSTLPLSYLFWLAVSELQQFPPPFQAPMIEDLTWLSLSLPVIPMPAVPPSTFQRLSQGSGVPSALLVVDPDRHSMMTVTTTTTTILGEEWASPPHPHPPVCITRISRVTPIARVGGCLP
ncbi:uncharacterized protein BXZ73DRAFT_105975 [Epithele typhae]|uniref:uncharacterized protein n=1 Tax=Epithele typhae TaxID=378194 RepID=UPI00200826D1|nr:uncharacterized protein BXZ73DRAFT_105975 [Epithele typhae]KAH9916113.1 hypothetical protein BXZ73DRAFT_105975 [Epithele typhae]